MKTIQFDSRVRFLYKIDLIKRVRATNLIKDRFENLSVLFSDIEFEIRGLNTAQG
jgi:hypothetical protein